MKASAPAEKKDSLFRSASGFRRSGLTKLQLAELNRVKDTVFMSGTLQQTDGYVQLASDLLAMAKRSGATEADVVIADGENLSVQVRLGAVDRLTKAREKRLGLRVFAGKRSACTSTSDFSADSLRQLVEQTCTLAKAVVEDPVSGLPVANQMAQEQPDLDLY